jgi:putative membrane protein
LLPIRAHHLIAFSILSSFFKEAPMRATRLTASLAATVAMFLAGSTARAQVTTSGGDVVTFTQKNVVDHLIRGDSIELEAAQLAASRTQNAAVRDYANMLITDHKAHLDNLNKLAGKADIGREASSSDTSSASALRTLTSLKALPADSTFDRAFIQDQIDHHTAEIAGLKALRPAAKDDDLQKDIDGTMPVLEKHLSRAKEVAAQLKM